MDIFYFREVEKAPVSAVQVKKETHNDPELSGVMDIISRVILRSTVCLKPYLGRGLELSVQSGCLLWGGQVIILLSLHANMFQQLHSGHSEIVRMKDGEKLLLVARHGQTNQ